MPIPSGARYPGESDTHRAARRAEEERQRAEAERAALAERPPKPKPRPAPKPAPKRAPAAPPASEPPAPEPPRRTWRDLDAAEINRY
ncbi:hypothetical protein CQ047_16585 [Microbacterium sp. MYb72]|uniref:hypothetical protein n=1 Tax=Microbacterium sp. MYb72 TaxID=1848693 RepID=UPI000D47DAB1|nr:hypothetical protein [Microbacterium sp. MYb72]PRB04606.1 hypothetical protein CQ047_16585 [Microbacterium sp. MYb72]